MLRVIATYRPNPPGRPFMVYGHHNAYFNMKQDASCPRMAFV
jgi:hypothetical protein